jgi:protein SCO1/2
MTGYTNNKSWAVGMLIALVVLAVLFGVWYQQHRASSQAKIAQTQQAKKRAPLPALALKTGSILPVPRVITAFQLVDSKGQAFNNTNLQGHWTIAFFGFTHCPMICPTTMATLKQSFQQLQTAQQKPMPQMLFVSVDPERDTPQRMNDYLLSFNKDFVGATGTKEQIDKLTQEMSVLYMKIQKAGAKSEDYNIDHSGTILLLDPKGQLFAVFSPPHNAQELAADLQAITKHYAEQY